MNINLHIDRIVLTGIDLGPNERHALQQAVTNQLTEMLSQQGEIELPNKSDNQSNVSGGSIYLGHSINATSLAPQLVNAIYGSLSAAELAKVRSLGGDR